MFKLTPDQRDLLQELIDHEGWPLISKLILPAIMDEQGQRVLTVSGGSPEVTYVVASEQLRYQGMNQMSKKLASLKDLLKPAKLREPGVKQK